MFKFVADHIILLDSQHLLIRPRRRCRPCSADISNGEDALGQEHGNELWGGTKVDKLVPAGRACRAHIKGERVKVVVDSTR